MVFEVLKQCQTDEFGSGTGLVGLDALVDLVADRLGKPHWQCGSFTSGGGALGGATLPQVGGIDVNRQDFVGGADIKAGVKKGGDNIKKSLGAGKAKKSASAGSSSRSSD